MIDSITFTFIEIIYDKIYMVIEKGHKPNCTSYVSVNLVKKNA